jgi:hypothetical protein
MVVAGRQRQAGARAVRAEARGLVVGNVYDDNTGSGLIGATVGHDRGGSTLSKATPLDANVDEGFYWLFTPPAGRSIRTREPWPRDAYVYRLQASLRSEHPDGGGDPRGSSS